MSGRCQCLGRRGARLPRPDVRSLGAMAHAASAAGCVTTARRPEGTALWRRLCGRWSADDAAMPARYRAPIGCRAFVSVVTFCVSEPRISARHQATKPARHRQRPELCSFRIGRGRAPSCIRLSAGATRTAQACRHAGSWAPPAWRPSGRVTGAFAPAALAATGLRRAHPPFAGPACERCGDQPAGCAANAAAMVSRSGVVGRPISLLKVRLSSNRLPPPADAEHCASTWAKPAGSPAWARAAA